LWIADDEFAKEKECFKDVESNENSLSTNSIPKKKRPLSTVSTSSSSSSSSSSSAPQNTTAKSKVTLKKPVADTKVKSTSSQNIVSTSSSSLASIPPADLSDEKTKYRKLMGCNKTVDCGGYDDENPVDSMEWESPGIDVSADEKPFPVAKVTRIKQCKYNTSLADDEAKPNVSSSNSAAVLSKYNDISVVKSAAHSFQPTPIKSIAHQVASKQLQLPLPEDTLEDGEIRELDDDEDDDNEDSDYAPSPVSNSSKTRHEGNVQRSRRGRNQGKNRSQSSSKDAMLDSQVIDAPLSSGTKSYHKNALACNQENITSTSSKTAPPADSRNSSTSETTADKPTSPILPYERMILYSYKDKETNQFQASLGMVVMQRGVGTDKTKLYWTIARLNPADPTDFYSTNFIVNKLDTYDIHDPDILCEQIYFDSGKYFVYNCLFTMCNYNV
jgi:hypothetical protein